MLNYVIAVIGAYLLGATPVGLVVVWFISRKDIRTFGSGRTGGTNAMRAAGPAAGVLTGVGDAVKGLLAVTIARLLVPDDSVMEALCAVMAVVGHNWSIYLGFRGGAGTGPNIGAAVALWPISGVVLVPLVPLGLVVTGYASVTSTLISLAILVIFVLRAIFAHQPLTYVGYATATLILVAISLIPNYRRLIAGTERMVGPRARMSQQASK
ncbi:MAG: glycerol-3-phosphate acyltransferase [Anaerolineae bacterium]|nr:glycerol-3-phosphate acyltransferase [Anaerolineae bacterium]